MNCKLEMPNGVKIECNEGVEKLFNLYKNLSDFGLIDNKNNNSQNTIYDVNIKNELDKCVERCQKLTNENSILKSQNEELTTQLLGIQNDTTDLDYLNGEVERLEKVESDLKAKLQTQKEDYEKKISELENKLKKAQLDIEPEPKEVKPQPNINIPEIKTVKPQPETKIEIPSNNSGGDFNPNNKADLAWLRGQLSNENPEENKNNIVDNREMIDGYYVERNSQGQIIKINDKILSTSEMIGLQYKITTVKKLMDNQKTIESNNSIVSGWEE